MREDSPAARITPAMLADRVMVRKIAESAGKVSEGSNQKLQPRRFTQEGIPYIPWCNFVVFVVARF
jgi:hypothetical protein